MWYSTILSHPFSSVVQDMNFPVPASLFTPGCTISSHCLNPRTLLPSLKVLLYDTGRDLRILLYYDRLRFHEYSFPRELPPLFRRMMDNVLIKLCAEYSTYSIVVFMSSWIRKYILNTWWREKNERTKKCSHHVLLLSYERIYSLYHFLFRSCTLWKADYSQRWNNDLLWEINI